MRLRHARGLLAGFPGPAVLALEREATLTPDGAIWRLPSVNAAISLKAVLDRAVPHGVLPEERPLARPTPPAAPVAGAAGFDVPNCLLSALLRPAEKRALDLLADWPWLSPEHLQALLGVSRARTAQITSALRDRGLAARVPAANGRLVLTGRGLTLIARRDRTSIGLAKKRWSAAPLDGGAARGWRDVAGRRSRQLLRNIEHSAAVHGFIAALAAQSRALGWELVQRDPPHRASRYFRGDGRLRSILPDAFAQCLQGFFAALVRSAGSRGAMTIVEWQLLRAGILRPPGSSPLLVAQAELLEQRLLEVAPGQPYLLRPDGSLDDDVIRYCNSESFRRLALRSQIGYAYDLRAYLSFLELHGVDWRVATGDDLADYEYWRRQDPGNPKPISTATFERELAAVRRFYAWQLRQGAVVSVPMLDDWVRLPDGTIGPAARPRPRTERSLEKMWLTPRQYRRWRDVGLRGFGVDNLRDSSWRGHNARRNRAFADTLWSSGLRLSEAAALLSREVPAESPGNSFSRGHVAVPVATGTGRDFWLSAEALRAIDAYRASERAAAVDRARRQGRYDDLRGVTVVSPGLVSPDQPSLGDRRRLFIEGEGGLEPASLWLTDSGTPMDQVSWERVFVAANARCASAGVEIHCHPHMLRHSFAFRILTARLASQGLLLVDPFLLVQTLLGLRSLKTTFQTYFKLHPEEHRRYGEALREEDDLDASLNDLLVQIAETRDARGRGGDA